jgi:hypothetical protein
MPVSVSATRSSMEPGGARPCVAPPHLKAAADGDSAGAATFIERGTTWIAAGSNATLKLSLLARPRAVSDSLQATGARRYICSVHDNPGWPVRTCRPTGGSRRSSPLQDLGAGWRLDATIASRNTCGLVHTTVRQLASLRNDTISPGLRRFQVCCGLGSVGGMAACVRRRGTTQDVPASRSLPPHFALVVRF